MKEVDVVGAGLAGAEAAWQLAKRGIKVRLFEMRPKKFTPAHQTPLFAELVCSNSLGGINLDNAAGLLKEELRFLDSLVIKVADRNRIPAGNALAVDRNLFAEEVTLRLSHHPLIEVIREEVVDINPERVTVIASGPLTSKALAENLKKYLESDYLYFFDAVAPIVAGESLDMEKLFFAGRYQQDKDYLNAPMNEEEYLRFYEALITAERHPLKPFEKDIYYEGCLPIEVIASRGKDTLRFGPLKPKGIIDPRTGKEPYAVVQLRRENLAGDYYNLVGFQTNLTWKEQNRVFRLIPGLENAEFIRFGVMHKNTFINSPALLTPYLNLKKYPRLFFAGQITGGEGYVAAIATGAWAGIAASGMFGKMPEPLPETTMLGGLIRYLNTAPVENFQPMGVNFGLVKPLDRKIKNKKERYKLLAERSLKDLKRWLAVNG
ncbi:methylenetetrahydrofolate--tRNA-(uracil(54)-C(5))-methyltransferase (FADH(2)-oxidizing) TrmFO [Carboxydothermus hydrogenoformans]|uniref:Methylenetetrahydrofolate--tRNA-(uracil-5-)-methyltransferase TrmFO n=1 Tax=Carboxydothermus hydrogenoformans (strain ATCC BAA-161 / DSM 6008 / Z-2901) TaxID=246194 RepID=TRMFO_CARHZ|nr:methylenetetrahydrofolate--tRNA-(uracil(54)-C(5))-methyltransferase (FADH(2)-oxidizing) TrmFO [Carboxydothermus hydrogenoformans]Q3AB71.1 RecName: Full=Methylenetetrahydrofolate--tRNA-(uracil-5-)-methyltransferase TrmFO; AltName: Full=Folate-dependent tRNA (uracil-5-)-methyltransferase; AltName: Full=Folate-dependent tRNA(M-5-U54)-methyltransferase [Carboxydothermus hydrogenoformans Z-2901]ABB15966.1 glucose inhibited division protein A [Carboxydothermus hydrogenoformans Z-2901]